MAELQLNNLSKIYGNNKAVNSINLHIADKEFIVIVGPSGCGKSTTLRMIAGLEDISGGEIHIGGRLVNHMQAKDRNVSMVFQHYALYPHMSAFQNISFGLEMRKYKKDEINKRVTEAAQLLGIEHLLTRRPGEMSGGEKQRVALGRAIVREPDVFLFDEPLSNLDAKLKTGMRQEIMKLHKKVQTTFVYVTHDQIEALTMADRIVVMNGGVIQQVDTPQNLYKNPANVFVAGFIGSPAMNFIPAKLRLLGNNPCIQFQNCRIPLNKTGIRPPVGQSGPDIPVILGIRPEHLHILSTDSTGASAHNIPQNSKQPVTMQLAVDYCEMTGADYYIYCRLNGDPIVVRSSHAIQGQTQLNVSFAVEDTLVFEQETGCNMRLGQENQ